MRFSEQEYQDLMQRRGVTPAERTALQEVIDKANDKLPAPLEDQEQQALVNWLRMKGIRHHATPNGEYRKPVTAKRLKGQGVQPGIPDLCIWPELNSGLRMIWIELKRVKGGRVSDEQQAWIDHINAIGDKHNMVATVCHGFSEARAFIESEGY